MLLGQISHDPLHPDFVPSTDRYFQTTATKRKRLETVAGTVERTNAPPGKLCVAFKMY